MGHIQSNDLFVVEEMQAFSGRNMRTRGKVLIWGLHDRNQLIFWIRSSVGLLISGLRIHCIEGFFPE